MHYLVCTLPIQATHFGVNLLLFQVRQADENAESNLEVIAAPDGYRIDLKRALEKEVNRISIATSDSGTVDCGRRAAGRTANISLEMQLRSATGRSKILDPFDPYPSDDE
jgi:hypothetical protein